MGSANWRHALERDFMFAPRRDGAELALRLLELVSDRDPRVQSRLADWLDATIELLPDVPTGDAELDDLASASVLAALMITAGADVRAPPPMSHVLAAVARIESMKPDEALKLFRRALLGSVNRRDGPSGRRPPLTDCDER